MATKNQKNKYLSQVLDFNTYNNKSQIYVY